MGGERITRDRVAPEQQLVDGVVGQAVGIVGCTGTLMIVGDGDGAEDVVHQVFVKLLAGPAPRDDIRSAEAYLRRAVRNECYSWLRARHRDALEPRHAGGPSLEPVQPTPQEDRVMLEQALRSLPPEQREVVHLKVFEGLTFAQIGDVTGVSSNTAASRYRYAIEKLGAHLGLEQQKPGRTA